MVKQTLLKYSSFVRAFLGSRVVMKEILNSGPMTARVVSEAGGIRSVHHFILQA